MLLAIGSLIYFWCLWDFMIAGRGTPLPIDPQKTLIAWGLYKYTRNPMYIGVVLLIIAWALLFLSWDIMVYGIFIAVMFHLIVVLYEEPHMRRKYGARYEHYCLEINRWIPSGESQSST